MTTIGPSANSLLRSMCEAATALPLPLQASIRQRARCDPALRNRLPAVVRADDRFHRDTAFRPASASATR
jgi:hypothetical protein